MKKIFAFMMAVVLCTLMAGCSSGVSQSEYDKLKADYDTVVGELEQLKGEGSTGTAGEKKETNKDGNTESPKDKFDEQAVISQLETTEYSYTSITKTVWTVLVVKNNSQFNITLDVAVNFKGGDGQLIGAKNGSEEALEAGYETAFIFMNDEKHDKLEYSFSAKKSERYECVQSELSYEATMAKNKAIVSVKNNGAEPARFVEYAVLFFNDGQIVYSSEAYAVDDDSEIKPGKTISKEALCYGEFDEVKVIVTGRR